MGLSSMPTPSEGVLTLLLVNTAMTISILKEILRSFLHFLGLVVAAEEGEEGPPQPPEFSSLAEEPSLRESFRSRVKPLRFGSAFGRRLVADRQSDCLVCLALFEPESIVNRLPCGHLFHQKCVERWLDYRNATCPLCRSHLLPADSLLASDGAGIFTF